MNNNAENAQARPAALPGLLVMILTIALSGCSTLGADGAAVSASSGAETPSARDQLNNGYSDLYSTAKSLSQVDRVFYFKIESDDVQRVVEDLTHYNGELAERLQGLGQSFPALDLQRQVDPPIINAARKAQRKATLKRFAPVAGASGKVFERGLLIRLLGAADQQHYLAATLAEREPNAALSEIMANAGKRYAGFYDEIDALLIKRFYR